MIKNINNDNFLMMPKNDYVFKRIFGDENNKDILIDFLKSVLKIEISDIHILNSELPKENIADKKSILDIRATIDNGINVDIEIQVARTIYMPQRSLYYWSKIYCEQLEVSERYSKLKKVICINILDFDTLGTKKYHSVFKIRETEENFVLTDLLEIHFLEMKKLKDYNEKDPLSQWINFIKADSKEVLEKMAKVNPKIDKAVTVLETMCQDKKARAEYLSREMALHDEVTRLEEALEEGRKEGIKEGIEEGIAKKSMEIALEMLKDKEPIEKIMRYSSLSKEDILKIKAGLTN